MKIPGFLQNMLIGQLEGKLKSQNPQAYSQYMNYKRSGKSPEQIINELQANGTITAEQVQQAQQEAAGLLNNNSLNNNLNNPSNGSNNNTGYTGRKRF